MFGITASNPAKSSKETPDAQAQAPVGADVITSATLASPSLSYTNATSNTVSVVTNITIAANTQRVRQIITGDGTLTTWIGYGIGSATNVNYLTTTNGIRLAPGTTWTNARPFLIKGPITLTVTNSLGGLGNTNSVATGFTATFNVREESGSY